MSKKKPLIGLNHIAIIPDGNRRWAREHGLRPWEGHFRGVGEFAKDIIWTVFDLEINNLTIWGGSYDNLTKRSKIEIRMLNKAYRQFAESVLRDSAINRRNVGIRFIGEWQNVLEPKTIELLKRVEQHTKGNDAHYLTILVAYNGDREMINAIKGIVKDGHGRVDADTIKSHLWTMDLPPVDLIIRTGNDPHLSAGFMMWDIQYAKLYFSKKMWPDFNKKDIILAIKSFSQNNRRFGK